MLLINHYLAWYVFNESMIAPSELLQAIDFISCFRIFSDNYINLIFCSFRNGLLQFNLISKISQYLECHSSGSIKLKSMGLYDFFEFQISIPSSLFPLWWVIYWMEKREENGNKEIMSFLPFIYINPICKQTGTFFKWYFR